MKDRNIGLDILRSVAIWNVLLMHIAIVLYAAKIAPIVWLPLPDGVDLFFVLSGYLIGRIMFKNFVFNKNSTASISKFLVSRWFRTLPNYYFLTFIVFSLEVLGKRHFFIPIYNLTFTQNLSPKIYNFYAETWSLCIEEWYYVIVPLFIFLITLGNKKRLDKNMFLGIILLLIIASPIIRFFYAKDFVFVNAKSFFDYRMITFIRLDSIAYGTLAAFFSIEYKSIWKKYCVPFFWVGLLLLSANTIYQFCILNQFLPVHHIYITNLNFIFNGIGVLLMLPKIESIQLKNEKLRKFFVHTSIISYSMYLLQMTIILNIAILIFMAVASVNLFSVAVFLVLYVLAVYYISHLNYKHIELPFLKLRDKILDKYFSKKAE
ncbi:MAG TPA: acyltransferase [Chitinophagales bacterium]|jgi:peptidoglycan/LPS O-acetylase OafA/YrhL|nr:acyltransferase [Chitinophagales bacterium]MBP6154841.1 acyltransferase [Chitinophagales bacterium]HQV78269.1 acyltransferase [Chitinophagales bacterium]HQW80149.1 acyltransferase [Chitinophagales bacterium]HRB92230.1 acyltransferase [Chitinophagales bacterium]